MAYRLYVTDRANYMDKRVTKSTFLRIVALGLIRMILRLLCRRVKALQNERREEDGRGQLHTLNFCLLKNCQKIFLSKHFCPKMQHLGLNSTFWKKQGQN